MSNDQPAVQSWEDEDEYEDEYDDAAITIGQGDSERDAVIHKAVFSDKIIVQALGRELRSRRCVSERDALNKQLTTIFYV